MAMDAKDLRIESALGAHSDDGNTKYAQSGTAFQTNGNKPYHDIGSNSLAKVDVPTARPCAIIGPDRVVPPLSTNDAYVKKVAVEPWPCTDGIYQHPPEYPHKPTDYQLSRNISPRQTFQENMQRIMVPPSYTSSKNCEDHCIKSSKLMPLESKFCDVPYTISPINNEPKIVKNSEGLLLSNNSNQPILPHGWASSGVNVRPLRPYGAPDLYQYSEYSNCHGSRPIPMIRPHRNVHEDVPHVYQDRYHEPSIRFKPYPTAKERPLQNPHSRYDYIPSYPNAFQPHTSYPPHKYELQKIPPHPYSVYPPVPLKYLERRMPIPTMDKYPRSNSQQVNFNQQFCNQNISSTYGALPGNCLQNRGYPYAADPSKNMIQNKLYFDSNNARKYYSGPESMIINDINRPPTIKTDLMYPSYPPMHTLPPHHMYRKENSMKAYEHAIHYRNIEYPANINPLSRLPLQFSPQTMSISPSESNTSNDTTQILANTQDDCGYASQSSTASIRSIESGINRISNDIYRRQDMTLSHLNKFGQKPDSSTNSKGKKDLNVRQFLQMWNEGDDEGNDNNKDTTKQRDPTNSLSCYESGNSQEQLYVLGLVNVPKEELGKYDHIQKISKLPENIKGYNSIEILNQYEKLVESPTANHFSLTPSQTKKDLHIPIRSSFSKHGADMSSTIARPLSPLDVEAKISQSVIHKEVGCNFEIRPCSPQMMNVELATPVHSVLGERLIEKVVNPIKTKSPICQRIEETSNTSSGNSPKIPSCKMANNLYTPHLNDSLKTNYSLQDLESNSGVCLASLPRLDNDIELNFPEINQQFINDNKIASIRDLPILDTENSGNANNSKSKVHNEPFIAEHLNSNSDSDKDTLKLSKYRKQKRNSVPNDNDDTLNMSLHRTDSVIIKNPENAKTQEDYNNTPPLNKNTPSIENIVNTENIVVESNRTINCSDKGNFETENENFNDCKPIDNDTAIDFSLNKCDFIRNNNINSPKLISDALQNNIEINTNICIDNEINGTDKVDSKISLKEEIAVSDNFSILLPKPPILDSITCSKVLINSPLLPPIVESNEVLHTHETVITHSKSKEPILDISLINTEDIVSPKNLPSLRHDNENVPISAICDGDISENITVSTNEVENQALNYSLTERLDDEITPKSELNFNLMIENKKDHDIIKDIDIEDISLSKQDKDHILSQEGVTEFDRQAHSDIDTELDNVDLLVKQESEDKTIQRGPIASEENKDTIDIILKNTNEMSNLEKPNEHDNKINLNSATYIDISNKYREVNHLKQELTNINDEDCIEPSNADQLAPISLNDFDSINTSGIHVFENEDILSKLENKTRGDIKKKIEMSTFLLNKNSNTEVVKDNHTSSKCQGMYEFMCNKELFSPRIQNLLIHNEGLCTSTKIYESKKKQPCYDLYKNNNLWSQEDDSHISVEPQQKVVQESVDLEFENDTTSQDMNSNIKNDETVCKTTFSNSIEFAKNELPMLRSEQCDSGNNDSIIDLEMDKVQQNNIISNDSKDIIQTESFAMANVDTALVEVARADPDYTVSVNSLENNGDINNHVKEKNNVNIILNQLPMRRNRTLKRSLSESAVTDYTAVAENINYGNNFMCTRKRPKMTDSGILVESEVVTDNLTNFIQNNRRNSVSTIYNDENVSFCIFIDNDCVITEENDSSQKICYTEISNECLTTICTEDALNSEFTEEMSFRDVSEIGNEEEAEGSETTTDIYYEDNALICNKTDIIDFENITYKEPEEHSCENDLVLQNIEDRTIEETWVEDVACMETIFSDDIAEDIVISAPSSPKESESSDDESVNTNFAYNISENEHTNKIKHIYGNQMCDNDAELVEKLYRTPQMNVNKTLIDRESQHSQEYNRYYDNESLEKILSESNALDTGALVQHDSVSDKSLVLSNVTSDDVHGNKENLKNICPKADKGELYSTVNLPDLTNTNLSVDSKSNESDNCLVHSCESSYDNFVSYKKEEKLPYAISSSPEVSSTTSEEKGPAILLKIRSYKGSKISEVNDMSANYNRSHSQRPLITKAAQKYIPPLKETIHDLKVKIRLPKQSLYKLQQLKKSKEKPKIDTNCSELYVKSLQQGNPKKVKPKPKFEDVLMSIDEIQLKKHKIKNKKNKQSIPKVIIKKNENGAHYASTQTNETFNPDLTGRKWQPWVFLEKSHFVDKMALKQKFKAIYSHRKKTYVLAENFRKYKSISNAKFVISHPKSNDNVSSGKLKYTFRLKHS